jgi:hypothetical protein
MRLFIIILLLAYIANAGLCVKTFRENSLNNMETSISNWLGNNGSPKIQHFTFSVPDFNYNHVYTAVILYDCK